MTKSFITKQLIHHYKIEILLGNKNRNEFNEKTKEISAMTIFPEI